MTLKAEKTYAKNIFDLLKREYPDVGCALDYKDPFQLLISTILSAQCTDERVNIVTKDCIKNIKNRGTF